MCRPRGRHIKQAMWEKAHSAAESWKLFVRSLSGKCPSVSIHVSCVSIRPSVSQIGPDRTEISCASFILCVCACVCLCVCVCVCVCVCLGRTGLSFCHTCVTIRPSLRPDRIGLSFYMCVCVCVSVRHCVIYRIRP